MSNIAMVDDEGNELIPVLEYFSIEEYDIVPEPGETVYTDDEGDQYVVRVVYHEQESFE